MKRLPPAKRNQLIMVLLGTAILIGLVYFFLIQPQGASNTQLANQTAEARSKLDSYKVAIKQAAATATELKDSLKQLNDAEQDVASGDVNAWTYDTLRGFKAAHHVDIPNIGQTTSPSEVDMIPAFPYKQIKVTLNGSAYYHDLGKFVADLENTFPHMRVLNLAADPVGSQGSGEHLNFHLEVVALVKPNS